jgi:hypothetical protein
MAKRKSTKRPSFPPPPGMKVPKRPRYPFPTEEWDDYKLFDDEAYYIFESLFFEPDGAQCAEAVADLFLYIAQEIDKGPEGAARASYTLKDAARFCFKYTTISHAAMQLFVAYISGELPPGDEPLSLICGALKRAGVNFPEKRR